MKADDLNKPLGLDKPSPGRSRVVAAAVVGGVALLALGAGGVWFLLPPGQGAAVTAAIDTPRTPKVVSGTPAAEDETGSITITQVDALPDLPEPPVPDDPSGVVIYNSGDPLPIKLASAPVAALLEQTDNGPLPRVADSGLRPLDVYARPSEIDPRMPRIAIVVGGVGIDPAGTRSAVSELPGTVTLAFAPYGERLAEDLAAARATGHEVLLQIPLEPFNYPRTDPGLNTLTADAGTSENLDRLHWLLGRMTNYVGIVNYMGARFTGEPKALKPVMDEIAGRGLLWLDDGSSPRSQTAAVAPSGAPYLRADMVLDADLSAATIDQRLRQLQAIARERGYAIATATAFPLTIERIAAFVRAAADRGIAVVPVSALVARPS